MLRLALYLASLVSIYQVVHAGVRVARGERKLTDRLFETRVLALLLAVCVLFALDTRYYLKNHIPDGGYDIVVEAYSDLWKFNRHFPAVLTVETYEDSFPYRDTEKRSIEQRYTLHGVFYGGKRTAANWRRLDDEVEVAPHQSVMIELDDNPCIITLGDVSAEKLGVTPLDNWYDMSITGKIVNIAVPALCVLGLVQGIFIDKTGKERLREWAKKS